MKVHVTDYYYLLGTIFSDLMLFVFENCNPLFIQYEHILAHIEPYKCFNNHLFQGYSDIHNDRLQTVDNSG